MSVSQTTQKCLSDAKNQTTSDFVPNCRLRESCSGAGLSDQLAQLIEQKNTISNELEKICNEMNILTLKLQTDSSSDVKKEYDELTEKCIRLVAQKQIITTKMLEVSIQLESNTTVPQVDTKISRGESICDDEYEYIYVDKKEELEKQCQFLEYQEKIRTARQLEKQQEYEELHRLQEIENKRVFQIEQQKQREQEKLADEMIQKEKEDYQKKLDAEIRKDIEEVSDSELSDDEESESEMERDDNIKTVKDDIIKLVSRETPSRLIGEATLRVSLSMKIFTNISRFDENINKIRHNIEATIGILEEQISDKYD